MFQVVQKYLIYSSWPSCKVGYHWALLIEGEYEAQEGWVTSQHDRAVKWQRWDSILNLSNFVLVKKTSSGLIWYKCICCPMSSVGVPGWLGSSGRWFSKWWLRNPVLSILKLCYFQQVAFRSSKKRKTEWWWHIRYCNNSYPKMR